MPGVLSGTHFGLYHNLKVSESMSELVKKERDFVIPGDIIVNSLEYLPGRNAYREGDNIYSKRIGIVSLNNRVVSVIPLTSAYTPKVGDMVIGEVAEIQSNGWVIDINSYYMAYLPLSGVREYIDTSRTRLSSVYAIGDMINAKIFSANSDSVHLSMQDPRARKLTEGRIIKINPAKVPRIIGKQGSMISIIKEKTNCMITVGQNGIIWISGDNVQKVIETIGIIENDAQLEGLTDKITEFLGGTK